MDTGARITLTSAFSGGIVMTSQSDTPDEIAEQMAAHTAIAARNGQTVRFSDDRPLA